jgi:flagellar basal body P-ring formation protein FlgA
LRILVIAAASLLLTGQAVAGQPVMLISDATDADGVVTLGDIFEGAGSAGQVRVAMRTGQILVLDAGAVQSLARRSGLDWANAEGIRRIVVRGGSSVGGSATPRGNVDVLAYARNFATGELVQPEDLIWAKAAAAPGDAPSDADQAIGLAAKRPLRAGASVSMRDIAAPQVIKTGDLVTVTFAADGLSLALQGKAMAGAARGENIAVLNTTSKKIIQAVASGPGEATIGPNADRTQSAGRTQIALR